MSEDMVVRGVKLSPHLIGGKPDAPLYVTNAKALWEELLYAETDEVWFAEPFEISKAEFDALPEWTGY